MTTVTVRYFAAAKAAAGAAQETLEVPGASGASEAGADLPQADFRALLVAAHPDPPAGEPPLETVLPQCSFLVDGVTLLDGDPVPTGVTVDVLPPFSGG
ncbi:MoaD/ThiS family protein [Brevibacterium litoralis]|uniref:MoaD/ThiS family protein n=1 Tax=Brevibacterium litoralis TaxID=3138935 RepID=UPI0032EAA7C4